MSIAALDERAELHREIHQHALYCALQSALVHAEDLRLPEISGPIYVLIAAVREIEASV